MKKHQEPAQSNSPECPPDESGARFREIFESTNDEIIYIDEFGRIVDRNIKGEDILGYTFEEVKGKRIEEFTAAIPPEQMSRMVTEFHAGLNSENARGLVELELRHRTGRPVFVEASISFRTGKGRVKGMIITLRDITQRTELTRALQEADLLHRTLMENVREGIVIAKSNPTRLIFANAGMVRMLGYSIEELLALQGEQLGALIHPDDRDSFFRRFRDRLEGKNQPDDYEFRAIRKDGTVIWATAYSGRVMYKGEPTVIAIFHDITARKEVEEEIRRSYEALTLINELLQISLKEIPLGSFLDRVLDNILAVPWVSFESRGCIFLIEEDPEVLVMRAHKNLDENVQDLCARVPLGRCLCGRAASTGQAQISSHMDERHENRCEGMTEHGHHCIPIVSEGRVLGVINLYVPPEHVCSAHARRILDSVASALAGAIERKRIEEEQQQLLQALAEQNEIITRSHKELETALEELEQAQAKLKASQAQLLQSEKLAAVGQLVSGVAHELNNPLMGISSTVELMKRYVKDEMALEDLTNLEGDTDRAIAIVRNLLSFARKQEPERKLISINEVIRSVTQLRAYDLRLSNIEVIEDLDPDLPETMADFQQMQQVFMNLIVNAEQAIREFRKNGRITVRSSRVEGNIRVTVTDDGPGIPREILGRIFEPFFTTKPVGKGTGLGLSICYGIVQEHQGQIAVESEEGHGATFTVELPIVAPSGVQAPSRTAAGAAEPAS